MNNIHKNSQVPIFQTERLILRDITEDDVDAYEKYFVDYDVISHLSSAVPWPYPRDGIINYFHTEILAKQGIDHWFWGISLKDNPAELIGGVSLWRKGVPENRGFWLGKKFWGKGIMTEAVIPIMNYAFEVLNFEKLVFANALGNDRSRRIKEKTGARFIGTKPAKFVNPEYSEHEIWELTKDEWCKANGH